jgi:hypothetical protein
MPLVQAMWAGLEVAVVLTMEQAAQVIPLLLLLEFLHKDILVVMLQ